MMQSESENEDEQDADGDGRHKNQRKLDQVMESLAVLNSAFADVAKERTQRISELRQTTAHLREQLQNEIDRE